MVGYDLATGAERWSAMGVPSGCCASPVIADGNVFFAGTGGSDDYKMPTFDGLLKDLDKNGDGALDRSEAEKAFEGFFDNQDVNQDGKVTRDEWDAIVRLFQEGVNNAFALKPGGSGDVTKSHMLWTAKRGLPYVSSAIWYRGQYVMVKDGGIVTALDGATGTEIFQQRVAAPGRYYASPVAANGNLYFTSLDGEITVLKGGEKQPTVVAQNPSLGERTAATPAIADNTIYVRTAGHVYAFAE